MEGVPSMRFKNIYIWYAIPVFLILLWLLAFYMPLSSKIKAKEKEVSALKNEIETLDTSINNILRYKSNEDRLISTIKKFESDIPVFDRFPDFIRGFVSQARRYGVVIVTFNSVFSSIDAVKKSVFVNPVFEIVVKGRFMDIAKFIEGLSYNTAYRGVRKAELLYDEKEYPILTGRFLIEFKSWRKVPKFEDK